jgi:ABC-type multidrug transport system fused ATPase/permease subunit
VRAGADLPLRRLLGLARSEAPLLAAATLVLLAGAGVGLLMPQAVRLLLDGLGTAAAAQALRRSMLMLLVALLAQVVAGYARGVLFTTAGERLVLRLRTTLYRALLDKEIAFFDRERGGELAARLTADTALLQQAVTSNLSLALRHALTALGCLVIMLRTSPGLTGLLLLLVPVLLAVGVVQGRLLRRLSARVQDRAARASGVADETLGGIRTVRAFAQEAAEAARYGGALTEHLQLVLRRARLGGALQALGGCLGAAALVGVLWYGGSLVVTGRLGAGALTAYLLYAGMLCAALAGLDDAWSEIMRAAGAGERVFSWLDPDSGPTDAPGGLQPAVVTGALQLSDVFFSYPTRPEAAVLRGLTLDLRPGEVVALVGPSGGGKSTVASLLLRLYDPQAGQVLLDGRDLRALDAGWLRRQVGVVAQEPLLFSMSIADNIRYARPEATQAEVEAAARAANIHDFIAGLPEGYGTPVGDRGVCLSGGQRQRVAIARALLKDPRVLILDEATSALDAESERLVQEALERLMAGRTTLVITHRPQLARRAGRVITLRGGRAVEARPVEVLPAERPQGLGWAASQS